MTARPPSSTLFPYTTLFRSLIRAASLGAISTTFAEYLLRVLGFDATAERSEEHTSELQSLRHLVCRLLLEKKKQHLPARLPRTGHDELAPPHGRRPQHAPER